MDPQDGYLTSGIYMRLVSRDQCDSASILTTFSLQAMNYYTFSFVNGQFLVVFFFSRKFTVTTKESFHYRDVKMAISL